MKKTILILSLLFSFLCEDMNAQEKIQFYQNPSTGDIVLKNLYRGTGGRALVPYDNNALVINFGGDFNGGTHVHGNLFANNDLFVKEKLHAKGLKLNFSSYGTWMKSHIQYEGNALIISSPEDKPHHCNLDFYPGGVDGKTLATWFNMYIATGKGQITSKVQIHSNGISYFNGGNVGIGTEKPQAKLDVNGTIRAKEVKIEATGWADYVFAKDYNLPSLAEVKAHIEEKQHLPNIPSEAEVKENGIDVGEMQIKLLQKIEELTLYVIKLNEENIVIKEELNRLKK